MTLTVANLLKRGASVLVAVSDDGVVAGWVCYERHPDKFGGMPIVHYAFTRDRFRRLGVMEMILAEADIDLVDGGLFTFRTPGRLDLRLKRWGWKHQPYIARIEFDGRKSEQPTDSRRSAAEAQEASGGQGEGW